MDPQDKARGLRSALKPQMGTGRNIGNMGSKLVLGDRTGIFTHLQEMEIIISLIKKMHGILSFRKLY